MKAEHKCLSSYLEDPVPSVSLHVVGGLVEVAHPGDVVLPGLSHDGAVGGDDDGRVPQRLAVGSVSLQDGGNDHHVILLSILHGER